MSDKGGTWGANMAPQRATPETLEKRKRFDLKNRSLHGRRPGMRPPAMPSSQQTQSMPSFMQTHAVSNQQNNGFGFGSHTGDNQNQTSVSFPPFGQQSSGTGFNTSFNAPSPSFSFSAAPVENNPFAAGGISKPFSGTGSFHGSIFNVDMPLSKGEKMAEKRRKENEVPQFASGAPDFPSPSNESRQVQMLSQNNPFATVNLPQQNTQNPSSPFLQPQATQQYQPSFSRQGSESTTKIDNPQDMFSGLYPPQNGSLTSVSKPDVFGAKPFVNPFDTSAPGFMQSQQSPSNPFASLDTQSSQPSSVFGQVSTSSTPPQASSLFPSTSGGDSMMQTSPDNSPEAGGKTFAGGTSLFNPHGSQLQTHPSPTKQSAGPTTAGSLFDRISAPTDSEDRSSSPSTADTDALAKGRSLFDHASLNTPDGNDLSPSSTPNNHTSQDQATSIFRKPSWPINNVFAPTTSDQASSTSTEASKSAIESRSSAQPNFFQSVGEDKKPKESPFKDLKFPSFSPAKNSSSASSALPQEPQASLTNIDPSERMAKDSSTNADGPHIAQNPPNKSQKTDHQDYQYEQASEAPSDLTKEEDVQFVTGYRLKALDMGVQHYLRSDLSSPEISMLKLFYKEKKLAILAAGGRPSEKVAGNKRKIISNGLHDQNDMSQSNKRAQSGGQFDSQRTILSHDSSQVPGKATNSLQPVISSSAKRKADDDLSKDNASGVSGDSKRLRGGEREFDPPLQPEKSSSQTSSIFKNILNTEKAINQPTKPSSIDNNGLTATQLGEPKIPSQSIFQSKPAASANILSPVANGDTLNQAPALPKQAQTVPTTTSSPFRISSSTPDCNSSNTSGFAFAPAAPLQPSLSNGQALDAFTEPGNTVSSKMPMLDLPKFGTVAPANFLSQFGEKAKRDEEEEKKKRKAEDFDSDEEDETAWERRDAETQRAKKQKIQEAAKLGPKFVLHQDEEKQSQTRQNSQDKASPLASNTSVSSVFEKSHPSYGIASARNIFGHLSDADSGAEGSKAGDADDEEDEDEDDAEQMDQPGEHHLKKSLSAGEEQPSLKGTIPQTVGANPFLSSSSPNQVPQPPGRSLFDRINKDGMTSHETPKPSSKPAIGLSQKPNDSPSQSPFSGLGEVHAHPLTMGNDAVGIPKGDHTWKADSPIKFGRSSPPAVNVTSPSPSKAPLSGLFGNSKANVSSETPAKPMFGAFSPTPTSTANPSVGFEIKPLVPAQNSLFPPDIVSRATSPGATTSESANESTGDAVEGEASEAEGGDRFDLTSRGLLENEVSLFDVMPSKAWLKNPSNSKDELQGRGRLRVLKDKAPDGLARILILSDPSGNEILNANLVSNANYPIIGGILRIVAQTKDGQMQNWGVKIAKETPLSSLKQILDANKKHGI